MKLTEQKYIFLIIITVIFLSLSWFVSDPVRAAKIDRYFLYSVDDIFRYCHVKASVFDGLVFFSPYVKLGYAVVARIFFDILPLGMTSLRIMNVLFSIGILVLIYRLSQKLYAFSSSSYMVVLLTVTFPVYFLLSISTLSEVMFCFFLISSIYLFYIRRYNSSILLVSLLPLFRQEGIIFLFIWAYFLKNLSQRRKILLLFIPFSLWMVFILLQNIFNHALLWLMPGVPPYNSVAVFKQSLILMSIFIYSPLVISTLIGFMINLRNKELDTLKVCFVSYVLFLMIFQVVHFLKFGLLCRELRIVMPLVPIMAILAGGVFDRVAKHIFMKKTGFLLMIASIIIIMFIQIIQLQRDYFVAIDLVTPQEEQEIKEISVWLNNYLSERHISQVYVPGVLTSHRVIRRLWMYLPGYIKLCAIPGDSLEEATMINDFVLDITALRYIYINKDKNGEKLLISTRLYDSGLLEELQYKLIKELPNISLYFYIVNR